jgi:UDP-glucose 4-epimerase
MKRILITGEKSYLGKNVDRYLQEYNASQGRQIYQVDMISLRDESWENISFAPYDTVIHMVGMAHADIEHVSEEIKEKYYEVNCGLAVRTAKKAAKEGVGQFIYMSSVIIYGDSAPVGKKKCITRDTVPAPASFYGDSKLKAEQELTKLSQSYENSDRGFNVAIIRSPMVYGRESRGNFATLEKLAAKLPIFPDMKNERSMIYIDNLAEFIRLLSESGRGGIFYPQNEEYVSTSRMVEKIGESMGRKIHLCSLLNPLVKAASHMPGKAGSMADKAFGSLTIDRELSFESFQGYCKYSLEESIKKIYENQYNHCGIQW